MKNITLSNGYKMPEIGFGVFQTESGEVTENAVIEALKAGYRHIDTAMIYGNEESVGVGMRKSGISREEIFLTTKLWNEDIRNGNARRAFEDSLKRLGTDYVDLYLLHWPANGYVEAWKILEELYNEGKIKSIGLSNFHKHHIDDIYEICTVKPMVNQIESNPYFANDELIAYCKSENIAVQVWSPLGGNGTQILSDPVLNEIAKKYNKCVAQIIIKWHLQRDVIVLPKSSNQNRIRMNFDVYDFELTKEDFDIICSLNKNKRSGADPDNFNF